MEVDFQTSPWPVVLLAIFLISGVLAGFWRFTYFWERMWTESLTSRSVNRRVLRWKRAAFHGHLPVGRWGGAGKVAYVHFVMLASRGLIVVMGLLLLFALAKRLLGHAA